MKIQIQLFVLDDDKETHDIIREALSGIDPNSYRMFDDYEEFIKSVDKFVHIAIIDHRLGGGKTGLEVMKELLAINPNCYVIIISGFLDAQLIMKYQEEGSRVFIDKNDYRNFAGKLETYVTKAYSLFNNMVEFIENQIEELRQLSPLCNK